MKQYPIHIRKIKTQFKAFFYCYNTKHPGFLSLYRCRVSMYYIFFFLHNNENYKICRWSFHMMQHSKTTGHAFRFMNIDIYNLIVQGLLFNSVISYAEHKDEKDTYLFISVRIFISFFLIYNQFYYWHSNSSKFDSYM